MEIYLDNSATTRPLQAAIDAAVFAMQEEYGNPSSLHKRGFHAELLLDESARAIANAVYCKESEIFFTSGATEANNLAVFGIANARCKIGKKIISTAIEHPSVNEALNELERQGFTIVRLLPNDDFEYTPKMFADEVDDQTILVCTMLVNNELGSILPVNEIAKAVKCKNKKTAVFVDAVQGFLKLPIKLLSSDIDLMSFSGHKVYAPKGVGALFVRQGLHIVKRVYGGNQQSGLRSGTEAVPLIYSFGVAVKAQTKELLQNLSYYDELKNYLLLSIKDNQNIKVNSKGNCAPYIVSLAVIGIRSEVMLHFLEQFEIYVSSGSACSKGKQSYVLAAFKIPKGISDSTIRISFSKDTTKDMIDEFVRRLDEGINSLARANIQKNR